jgi:hypothetical protein
MAIVRVGGRKQLAQNFLAGLIEKKNPKRKI